MVRVNKQEANKIFLDILWTHTKKTMITGVMFGDLYYKTEFTAKKFSLLKKGMKQFVKADI